MLKAVFFDAAGTLIYLPISVGEHYRRIGRDFGLDVEAAAFDQAFKRAWADSPPRPAQIGPRLDDDKGWWRNLVRQVVQEVSSASPAAPFNFSGYFEAVYNHFAKPGVWMAYEDVHPTLQALRSRGLNLGVISNFDRRLHPILQELGLSTYFNTVTLSSEVGSDKPDPQIFQAALRAMQVNPAEAVHVGDDPHKDWGAGAVGLQVFPLQRPMRGLNALLQGMNSSAA